MSIILGGSKSISNRVLIIQALYGNLLFKNISKSNDTKVLKEALELDKVILNISHAGTAMRFLTSFLAIQEGKSFELTGSSRMKERPISKLVDALQTIGADISYLGESGFPPLKINGKEIIGGEIEIDANISSQYLTSLILIGSFLKNGLTIIPKGKLVSLPYIMMSLKIQNKLGIESEFSNGKIIVPYTQDISAQTFFIESDWSSASYYYSLMALTDRSKIIIKDLKPDSIQADSIVAPIYKKYFGIDTEFYSEGIRLTKIKDFEYPSIIELDCSDFPDIAQTIIVTSYGLQIPTLLKGLETLKIKETDRILALQNELIKFGGITEVGDDFIILKDFKAHENNILLQTYHDHRMAMAFAPLLSNYTFEIENKEVVKKSYPNFWEDFLPLL